MIVGADGAMIARDTSSPTQNARTADAVKRVCESKHHLVIATRTTGAALYSARTNNRQIDVERSYSLMDFTRDDVTQENRLTKSRSRPNQR